jgi:hypothetical protein
MALRLWGSHALVWLSSGEKYCPDGGMAFAHCQTAADTEIVDERRATEGSIIASWPPFLTLEKRLICR